ncbi:uncharacterized protein BJ171DRAFT_579957 [Polychytrium aggregatum]|uniref:uncharacterized protein n=1 Tax=Polychytrium aggregatum TaxID=110093 RepID=UPI0022FEAB3A|nr:uncharacterized protein BJ171DRAFT_579957 [Polychytrium aggregatum]KAI9206462.1 hypothetical protein BJ171DRAFT_579957 [Polychytrium aggregatum]
MTPSSRSPSPLKLAVPASLQHRPAPVSFYLKAGLLGFAIGAALELTFVKTNSYEIMKKTQARKRLQEQLDYEALLQYQEEQKVNATSSRP